MFAHSPGIAPIVVQAMYGITAGALTPLLFVLFAEIPQQLAVGGTGCLNGLITVLMLIALKSGALGGSLVVALLISHSGYLPNQPQSLETQRMILLMVAILPAGLFAMAASTLHGVR